MDISVEADGTSAYIFFDYLDKGQGGIIQVIHTGLSSSDLTLNGDIKGARLEKVKPRDRILRYSGIMLWICVNGALALNILGPPFLIVVALMVLPFSIIFWFSDIILSEAGLFKRFSSPLPKVFHQTWYD
jgi:hypothetical protein